MQVQFLKEIPSNRQSKFKRNLFELISLHKKRTKIQIALATAAGMGHSLSRYSAFVNGVKEVTTVASCR